MIAKKYEIKSVKSKSTNKYKIISSWKEQISDVCPLIVCFPRNSTPRSSAWSPRSGPAPAGGS